MKRQKNQRGQMIVEAAVSFPILIIMALALLEIMLLTSTIINTHKIAREGAREAAITGSIEAGINKAEDCSQQYFGGESIISLHDNDGNVVCMVTTPYLPIKFTDSIKINIDAEAVYPFQDNNS